MGSLRIQLLALLPLRLERLVTRRFQAFRLHGIRMAQKVNGYLESPISEHRERRQSARIPNPLFGGVNIRGICRE